MSSRERLIRSRSSLVANRRHADRGRRSDYVSLASLNLTLVTVVGCHDIASCDRHPRAELIEALGHGFGATAAHELGHQAGLQFVRDLDCADCWDGVSATDRSHFLVASTGRPVLWRRCTRATLTSVRIDINSDVGESFGAYTIGHDTGLMKAITSANVAAGFHAGDPTVLRETIRMAKPAAWRWAHIRAFPIWLASAVANSTSPCRKPRT